MVVVFEKGVETEVNDGSCAGYVACQIEINVEERLTHCANEGNARRVVSYKVV